MKCIIETERLCIRRWTDADRIEFRKMNSDPQVMEYFPNSLKSEESDQFLERIVKNMDENGYGLWAVETKKDRGFIGFTGFNLTTFRSDFTPCVEIGWRLRKEAWGKGYATEGARACLRYGFDEFQFTEVYSFTSLLNWRSIKVMERIGMERVREFDHPNIKEGHRLRRHVLFRLFRSDYRPEINGSR
ncbi:MAG TPA: GNAT family N-acetyltransferase [Candidatus Acidoferrales bacterium]|nr:GNAT family N-acetyltransferase [Candidatus Acidoferrales bacterium]